MTCYQIPFSPQANLRRFSIFFFFVCVFVLNRIYYTSQFLIILDVQGNENLWARLICLGALLLLQFYITRVEHVAYLLLRAYPHNAHTNLHNLKS